MSYPQKKFKKLWTRLSQRQHSNGHVLQKFIHKIHKSLDKTSLCPLSPTPLFWGKWSSRRFREKPKENRKNSWRCPQKSNFDGAADEIIWEQWIRTGRQLEPCPVTEDGLVLPWPLFWKTGTWKPATVDTGEGLNTTNWTEVNTRALSQITAQDESDAKIFTYPGSERCPVKNAQELPGTSQMLCFRDQEMVKERSSIPQTTKSGFEAHLLSKRAGINWTTSHKPLPQSHIC